MSLFEYLIDAKDDMDRVQDSLKDITNKLDNLFDMVEYEAVAKEIR
jgi:septation ring formation regulator EzrA